MNIKNLKTHFERLEVQRLGLFERLDKYDSGLLKIPEKEKWSVNQVLVHLITSEEGTVRYIRKKTKYPDAISAKGIGTTIRSILLKWMLGAPLKYRMPKTLQPPSNEFDYDELKSRYESVRKDIDALIDELSEELLTKEIFRHPFAGRFSMLETLKFFHDHFARHSKQVDRILKSNSKKSITQS